MGSILLLLICVVNQGEAMTVRSYGKKHQIGGMFFNAVICFFAMIFFILTDKEGLKFSPLLINYGIISGVLYAMGFYTMYISLCLGSFIATKLVSSLSILISFLYGAFYIKEPVSYIQYIAIILFMISLVMANYIKKSPAEDNAFSFKWLFYVLICAISNGFIAVVAREQQLCFNYSSDNEFMILSYGAAFLFLSLFGIFKEKNNVRYILKNSILYGAAVGGFNGAANLLSLILYAYMPVSVAIPVRSSLGFILSFLISTVIYKESFTKLQLAGVITGIISVVLFNAI